jgi:hypothetical protein
MVLPGGETQDMFVFESCESGGRCSLAEHDPYVSGYSSVEGVGGLRLDSGYEVEGVRIGRWEFPAGFDVPSKAVDIGDGIVELPDRAGEYTVAIYLSDAASRWTVTFGILVADGES